MNPQNILVLGTKGSVVAMDRTTGAQLWAVHLKSAGFVSVIADQSKVFAHTSGEVYCLDLFTGTGVWNDSLRGFGFDTATLALPGTAQDIAVTEHLREGIHQAHSSD
jgi:outer membrane protein assembly factor BamB